MRHVDGSAGAPQVPLLKGLEGSALSWMYRQGRHYRMLWACRFCNPSRLLMKIFTLYFASKQDCGSLVLSLFVFLFLQSVRQAANAILLQLKINADV